MVLNIYQSARCRSPPEESLPPETNRNSMCSKNAFASLCEQMIYWMKQTALLWTACSAVWWRNGWKCYDFYLVWEVEGSWLPPGRGAAGPAAGCAASGLPAWCPFFPAFCPSISSEPALYKKKKKNRWINKNKGKGWEARTSRIPVGIQYAQLEAL